MSQPGQKQGTVAGAVEAPSQPAPAAVPEQPAAAPSDPSPDAESTAAASPVAEGAVAVDAAPSASQQREDSGEGGEGQEQKVAAPTAKRDWRDDRIRVLTRRLRESQRQQQEPADTNAAVLPEAEISRRAAELAAQNDFARRCNEVAEKGKAAFPDFMDRVEQLRELVTGGSPSEEAGYLRLLEAALETDEPSTLLYELGGSPERAQRLMGMSPVKLGVELAKMAAKKPAADVSLAPRPIRPVDSKQTPTEINPADPEKADKLSTRTWIERRQREVEARRKAGERIW